MPRFSANLGFLFADRPYPDRVRAAARAGFPAVEMHWPYDVPAQDLAAVIAESGVAMLGLNTRPGNAGAGEFGLGAVPGREAEFQDDVDQCLVYAAAIGATSLHCMAGVLAAAREAAEATFVENLRAAADKAARADITLLIEPINPRDRPDYALSRIDQAAAILERVGRSNVRIMFDCYHVQITEGDLSRKLSDYLPLIGHVQIAAVPSRAEPDEGEVNYEAVLRHLDAIGYAGHVGAEYKPRGRTEDGLGWLARYSTGRE
jgi:hydroxypyruvate isomerase